MTGATCCSGIGAPEVAMPHIDWRWCAEIEKFPSAVLKHYRPDVPNLGDITAGDFIERALALGPIGLLVAGTPCQSFSLAGNRRSLSDERGNLTLRFVEIVDAIQPRFVLWENVRSVLQTPDNAFGCFLAALVGADTALVPPNGCQWTDAGVADGPRRMVAWRVLDAEYFGVPQQRERVFVVASDRDGSGPEALFEREGVQRHFAPRREAGAVATALTANGVGTCGADDNQAQGGHLLAVYNTAFGGGRCSGERDVSTTLTHHGRRLDFDTETFIAFYPTDGRDFYGYRDVSPTIKVGSGIGIPSPPGVTDGVIVRRLTVRECERLMGFPDDYTAIAVKGKLAADGPRYKALGNSMAVPVIRWIGRRIMEACHA